MLEVDVAMFVAEQLERGGSSTHQTFADDTKRRAGRRKGSTNKPRTGRNKTKAAGRGDISTTRGLGRPKGSLNKPKHGQAAVRKPKAKMQAKA
eukprot:222886-Chlamydomonas_euryale.AAC.2